MNNDKKNIEKHTTANHFRLQINTKQFDYIKQSESQSNRLQFEMQNCCEVVNIDIANGE